MTRKKPYVEYAKTALEIATQFATLGVLVILAFILMTMNSCSSYPQMPPGDYGVEPVKEYFAVRPLEPGPHDDTLVEVRIGELRQAIYVHDAYEALLDAVNTRGSLIEELQEDRAMFADAARKSRDAGQRNTVVGMLGGVVGGFFFGFTVFAIASIGR